MTGSDNTAFTIELGSFGYKYGEERGELVFDLRFLPNPYYVDSLKPLSGKDMACANYVLNFPAAQKTLQLLKELVLTQVESFRKQGQTGIKVRLGCTGGRHRSVALVEALAKAMEVEVDAAGTAVSVIHRDIDHYSLEEE